NDLIGLPGAVGFVAVPQGAGERRPCEGMRALRVVMEADLQGYQTILPQIDALCELMLLPIPEVQSMPIFIRSHILQVEPRLIGLDSRTLGADHDVVA